MNKVFLLRIISLILVICTAVSFIPVGAEKAGIKSELTAEDVSKKYDEFFENTKSYQDLLSHEVYGYRAFAEEIDGKNSFTKGYLWCVNFLMDKKLDEKAYYDYLTKLLAMMENGFVGTTAAQAEYTARMSGYDRLSGVVDIALGDILGSRYDKIKDVYSVVSGTADAAKNINEVVTDITQLSVIVANDVLYKQKVSALKAIMENTDDKALKAAASDLTQFCDLQMLYIIENYNTDIAVNVGKNILNLSEIAFKDGIEATQKAYKHKFHGWLTKIAGNDKATKFISMAGKFMSALSSFSLGFKIGVEIMKNIHGDKYEMYREMLAMNNISEALIEGLGKANKNAESTSNANARYEHIFDFVAIGKMLIYSHLRGEYCCVASADPKSVDPDRVKSHYGYLVESLGDCEEALSSIFELDSVFVVSDEFKLYDGFIKPVEHKSEVPEGYIGIYSFSDWQKIKDNEPTDRSVLNEYNTANYILMGNVTFPDSYESLEAFGGILDGNGYTIYNVGTPLMNLLTGATVKNLGIDVNHVENFEDIEQDYGALARYSATIAYGARYEEESTVDNCFVKGLIDFSFRSGDVGGIIGSADGVTFTNCYNNADVKIRSRQGALVGGITGCYGEIINCFNTGKISAYATCENTFNQYSIDVYAAGITAYKGEFKYCYNSGDVSAGACASCDVLAAGIVGDLYLGGTVENCINTGAIKVYSDYTAESREANLKEEEGNESLFGIGYYSGGIAAKASDGAMSMAKIANCWNEGAITGRRRVGGIIASGYDVNIENCFNTGGITGEKYVGGIAGYIDAESNIKNCYNRGAMGNGEHVGSLAGDATEAEKVFENCYYLSGGASATSVGANYSEVHELSDSEMSDPKSFKNFDFNKVWTMKKDSDIKSPQLRFRTDKEADED